MGTLQLITITTVTVGKILLCSAIGLFVSRFFTAPEQSVKGLSVISVLIFLPCLLFSNLVLRVTWEELHQFYWAPLLACLPASLGFGCSKVFKLLLPPHWHGVLTLGCTFQNGLTFSLSVILTLKGVTWLTPDAVERAQSYIFLYNIVCSFGLWAIGEPLIRSCKQKLVQERLARRRRQLPPTQPPRHDTTSTVHSIIIYPYESHFPIGDGNDGGDTDAWGSAAAAEVLPRSEVNQAFSLSQTPNQGEEMQVRKATTEEQLVWYRPPDGASPISLTGLPGGVSSSSLSSWAVMSRLGGIMQSPPIAVSLGAVFISLVPPLRWVAESPLGSVVIGGMKLIGAGAIPLQLLVLGCTVAASRPPPVDAAAGGAGRGGSKGGKINDGDDDEESDDRNDTAVGEKYLCVTLTQPTLFAILTVGLRLVFIPAVCFLVIHFLLMGGIIPSDRVFLLSMLLGTCAPTAINSSLICSMHEYKARSYAQMIFTMYLSAIVTTALWLAFYIWYLG